MRDLFSFMIYIRTCPSRIGISRIGTLRYHAWNVAHCAGSRRLAIRWPCVYRGGRRTHDPQLWGRESGPGDDSAGTFRREAEDRGERCRTDLRVYI